MSRPKITVSDVLRVFPGAKDKPLHCDQCNQPIVTLRFRGGKIIERIEPDRRNDKPPLADHDRVVARQIAETLRVTAKEPAIIVTDIMRIFPGARIIEEPTDEPKPSICPHCDKESTPCWRRGGKIIQRVEPNGTRIWACHYCGRRAKAQQSSITAETTRK